MKVSINIKENKRARRLWWAAVIPALALCAALLAACANTAASSVGSAGASPSSTPVPTTPPDETAPAANGDLGEDSGAITYNGWVYYLDVNDPVVVDFNEDPPVHMRKEDGSGDQPLGIRGFQFDVIGDYIYVDSNDPDLDAGGAQTWSTTRMNLDGTGMKKLEYGSMSKRLVPEGDSSFYFTTRGDSAIYVSDFACENVQTLAVNLPDKAEIDGKLGAEKVLLLDISDITDGKINFSVTFSNADGIQLYSGSYSITADGATTQKIKGTYYNYSSQNESD